MSKTFRNLAKLRQRVQKFVQNSTRHSSKLSKIPRIAKRAELKKMLTAWDKLEKSKTQHEAAAKRDAAKIHALAWKLHAKLKVNFERCEGYLAKKDLDSLFRVGKKK